MFLTQSAVPLCAGVKVEIQGEGRLAEAVCKYSAVACATCDVSDDMLLFVSSLRQVDDWHPLVQTAAVLAEAVELAEGRVFAG